MRGISTLNEIRSTFSTSTLCYWTMDDGVVRTSASQLDLRGFAALDLDRLSLETCPNLPSIFRLRPFWANVRVVAPGHDLVVAEGRGGDRRWWEAGEHRDATFEAAADQLRHALRTAVERRLCPGERLGADLSGGMDSTSLAYLVEAVGGEVAHFHAGTADAQNQDSRYARRAAAELRGEFVELPSFTSTLDAFATAARNGERTGRGVSGPPAWRANMPHLEMLFEQERARDIRTHINGLGGDELFALQPAIMSSLVQSGAVAVGLRSAARLARAQRWPVLRTLAAVCSTRTLGDELVARVHADASPHADAFGWAPGFGVSRFASAQTRARVEAQIRGQATAGIEPHFPDRARHQMAESVMFQGEIVRQVNEAFADEGVHWEAPFLDDEILRLMFGLSSSIAIGQRHSKPLLAASMKGLAPEWIFSREDKGEYSADLFSAFASRIGGLKSLFRESFLVDQGLLNPDAILTALEMPVLKTHDLFEIEQLATLELWAREMEGE
ncbi:MULTISPECIES: asparagine synthase-related protein [unclassified Pseudoclavibacter]|uniref:asparagine synthase-related protein n=1 Tax=unclassified Pseudoclavibacter TaxID=2615177 RepID=UPI000CE7C27B|nr:MULTISPECIES: asparagine synthase-related protein [unclassified Pseudoclavibacter]MBF4552163.1 asparagine synthetase B family protein [Pseudoclavibacter sp. VKM Ac-2888]PPF77388.1 hypothetical protein C5B99_03620 [Pseudoclavibacter sp. Z016]